MPAPASAISDGPNPPCWVRGEPPAGTAMRPGLLVALLGAGACRGKELRGATVGAPAAERVGTGVELGAAGAADAAGARSSPAPPARSRPAARRAGVGRTGTGTSEGLATAGAIASSLHAARRRSVAPIRCPDGWLSG